MTNHLDIEQAYRECEDLAFRHYENFPVASVFIPRDKRKYVAAIYAFARTADDFADEDGLTPEERLHKLQEWEAKLRDSLRGHASDPIFVALAETIAQFDLPLEHFTDLLKAFGMDVQKNRYRNWQELLGYCKYSANPVGRLILRLFNYNGKERLLASDALCTALQLTNFWQDLSIDARRNRIYIPLEDAERFSCSESDILSLNLNQNFQNLMDHEVARTAELFETGRSLLTSIGPDLRFQLKFTWLGGMKILEKIRRARYDVIHRRPRISLWDKIILTLKASSRAGNTG